MVPPEPSLSNGRSLAGGWMWLEGRALAFDWGFSDRMPMVGGTIPAGLSLSSGWYLAVGRIWLGIKAVEFDSVAFDWSSCH